MKLYAKIKAHKKHDGKDILVEKGQGTNEYMSILINDEDGKNLIEVYAEVSGGEIVTTVSDYSTGEKKVYRHMSGKGEKKKGEHVHDWQKQTPDLWYCGSCDAAKDSSGGVIQ